jgi:hypothetical protein
MADQLKKLLSDNWGMGRGYTGTNFENFWINSLRKVFGFLDDSPSVIASARFPEHVMDGTGSRSGGTELDGLLVLGSPDRPFDMNDVPHEVVINFEFTVITGRKKKHRDYWLDENSSPTGAHGKLIKLLRILKPNTAPARTVEERLKTLRKWKPSGSPKYSTIPRAINNISKAYLLGFDRYGTYEASDWLAEIQEYVRRFDRGRFADYRFSASTGGSVTITTPYGCDVIFKILNLGEMADVLATIEAIAGERPHVDQQSAVYSRILTELTSLIGSNEGELFVEKPMKSLSCVRVHSMREKLLGSKVTSVYSSQETQLNGLPTPTYRFTMKASELMKATRVMRTVSNIGSLQRIPKPSHMKMISSDLGDKLFVNPIVVSTNKLLSIRHSEKKGDHILPQADPKIITPYSWDLIDGQHRVFACYYTDPELDPEFEVVLFNHPLDDTEEDRAIIDKSNSSIFYDLNYRIMKADPEIALVRAAYINEWTTKRWDSESPLQSSRVLASRFLIELDSTPGPLKGVFHFRGLAREESLSIKSVSTYFSQCFEFDHRGRVNPGGHSDKSLLRVYDHKGVIRDSVRVAFEPEEEFPDGSRGDPEGPTPSFMAGKNFWEASVMDFNKFLQAISSNARVGDKLFTWVAGGSHVLPALFHTYVAFLKTKLIIPTRTAAENRRWDVDLIDKIAKHLDDKNTAGVLIGNEAAGMSSDYTGASGVSTLRRELIAEANKSARGRTPTRITW